MLPSKFCLVDVRIFLWEKQVFLFGFSLTFLRFLCKSKYWLNTSLNCLLNIEILKHSTYYKIFCEIFFISSQGPFSKKVVILPVLLMKWNTTFYIDLFSSKQKVFSCWVIEYQSRWYKFDLQIFHWSRGNPFLQVCGIPHNLIKNIFKWVFTQFFNKTLSL